MTSRLLASEPDKAKAAAEHSAIGRPVRTSTVVLPATGWVAGAVVVTMYVLSLANCGYANDTTGRRCHESR